MVPPVKVASADWGNEKRLANIVTWLAGAIASVITLASPLGYFWLSYEAELKESAVAARLHATFVTQAIVSAEADWQRDVQGLIEVNLSPGGLPEQRSIVDEQGRLVSASGPDVEAPTLSQSEALLSAQGRVGKVLVVRSLRPLLWQTLGIALMASVLGALTYLSLRVLPLRALRRALQELRRQEAQQRENSEARLRVVLENVIEGVVVFEPRGEVLSTNAAAARMLGYVDHDLAGLHIVQIVHPTNAVSTVADSPFPLGLSDAVARRRDGSEFQVEFGVSELMVDGVAQRLGIIRDVTERRQHEARLSRMANYDGLTGLPNRSLFRDRLQTAMARSRRSGRPFALMFLDLDRFKYVNDSLGHDIGDRLLVEVSKALLSCMRETDSVARTVEIADVPDVFRLGGDEFTILAEDLTGTGTVTMIAERILERLSQPFMVGDHELFISTSIGITLYTNDTIDIDGLIKQADMAMYRSKELGRDTFCFFDERLNKEAGLRHELEGRLRHALERNEFLLHYQPKADLATGQVTGVEALLRWQPTGQALVGPERFIPVLEETGLIVPVGAWVLHEGCRQMMEWERAGMPPMNLAVNLSARQFRQKDLVGMVELVLRETGFDPTRLQLELTESMLINDTDAAVAILATIGAMGVSIAIDDFGTGHSSLSYLKKFDIDTLKIDRSFVRDTPHDADDCTISRAVIALGHGLGLRVVAEGVETEEQLDFLRREGCDELQGYLLSRPLTAQAFASWYAQYGARESAPMSA